MYFLRHVMFTDCKGICVNVLFILLLIQGMKALGQTQPVLEFGVDDETIELARYSYVLTDTSFQLTADQVYELEDHHWQKGIIEGYCEYPMWARFELSNTSNESFNRIFYLNNPFVHEADVYFIIGDSVAASRSTGLARPKSSKLYNDPMFPMSMHVPANSDITVLLKVYDPLSTMYAPAYILSSTKADALKDNRLAFSYLWIGSLTISMIFAFFLLVTIRKEIFIQYLFLGLATSMIIVPNIGAVFIFMDSDPYQIVTNIYQFGAAFLIVFMPRFLNCIVPISTIQPRLWEVVKGLGYFSVFICILNFIPALKFNLGFIKFVINSLVYLSSAVFAYLLITLGIAAFRRMKHAVALFIIYLIYLNIAFIVVIAPFFGLEIEELNSFYFLLAGSAFETVAFMLMMAQVTLSIYKERDKLNLQVQNNQKVMIDTIVKGQEAERKRVAKDLHDGFGGMITSLNLYISSLIDEKSTNLEKRMSVFEASKKVLSDMYTELRNICFNLMPQTLITAGIGEALREFANRINQSDKVFVSVSVFGLNQRLSQIQEISVYRICQEWINNVLKYNSASKIDIQLTCDEEEITLTIEDNGMGFNKNRLIVGSGNGWKNIISRAELIKGDLEMDTTENVPHSILILNAPIQLEPHPKSAPTSNSEVKDT